jgi:hypothetical protein
MKSYCDTIESEYRPFVAALGVQLSVTMAQIAADPQGAWHPIAELPGVANVPTTWNAMVLIAGSDLQLGLRLYFQSAAVQKAAAASSSTLEHMDQRQILDFAEEMANQLGGAVKNPLVDQGLHLGHSLPVAFKAYYHAFERPMNGIAQHCFWKWSLPGWYLALSIEDYPRHLLEIDLEDLARFDHGQEVEFL